MTMSSLEKKLLSTTVVSESPQVEDIRRRITFSIAVVEELRLIILIANLPQSDMKDGTKVCAGSRNRLLVWAFGDS